jgi:cytochrome P450
LLTFGSDEQKQRWAVPILQAEMTASLGMSEPGAGSDLAGLKTRAVFDGDHFVVNGQNLPGRQHIAANCPHGRPAGAVVMRNRFVRNMYGAYRVRQRADAQQRHAAKSQYGNVMPQMRITFSSSEIIGVAMAEDLTSVDFFRDRRLTDDPYPFYEALRNKCPVSRENHYGVTMVTGWQEAVDVYNDADTFSSCISVTGPFPGFPVPLEGDDVTETIKAHRDEIPFSDQLPTLDPPTHTNHRALLMRLITPKRLKENEDAMWQIADDILDGFLAPGEGEFITGFAGPFTLRVIADLLGVPDEDRPELLERLARGTHGSGLGSTESKTLAKTPLEYLYDVFATYIEDRRAEPRDDVLTGLAAATFPDGTVPEVGDVVRVATNVFSAGQETTVRLLGTALKVLGERSDIQAKLREDRSLLPNFIEECLRIESPVKGDFRLSRVPRTVGEETIGAGCTVMVINGAANRDPRRFEDPDTFDPERKNARQHLAFGRGIHSCPGAPLARAETRVGLERLLDRTTDIRIGEPHHGPAEGRRYRYIPTYILRGLTELHLEFGSRRR